MSFFNDLLTKRQLDTCPTPLWKLKIKDSEYQELKTLLAQESVSSSSSTPYKELCRECTLFYAEYWRREYNGSPPSRIMVFNALGVKSLPHSDDWSNWFYNSALKGSKLLKIEMYDGERAMPFYSMLYQGGVPMNIVIKTNYNGNWDRFVRGLVFRNISFEDLNLGRVASQSQSMRMYCSLLSEAVNVKQYKRLPFYCDNEYNPWFLFLLNKFSSVRQSSRLIHPFVIDWECTADKISNNITIKCNLKGMQRLSHQFLEEHNLINLPSFTINVNKNGRTENSFDYINGFCRYEVQSILKYSDGDVISLNINDRENPFISETLDMNTPHLLYRTVKRTYKFGNKIGKEKSLIIIPKEWSVESCDNRLEAIDYTWGKSEFKGLLIPSEYNENIFVSGPDGKMTFSNKSSLYWTEISGNVHNCSSFIEPIYNANRTSFVLCYEGDENIVHQKARPVEFRDKGGSSWGEIPSCGEIFARTTEQNGSFVTPVKIINVGDNLVVSILQADRETCKIKVNWQYGDASPQYCGRKLANGYWLIKKDDCEDPRKIPFLFTPKDNIRNAFVLNLKAPFKDFSICDDKDVPLGNNQYIPFSDLDRFQYHIHGIEVHPFKFGNQERIIYPNGNTHNIVGNNLNRNIPFDGALIRLFDSREQIRQMLDLTSKNMLEATVPVEFVLNSGERLNFEIKEFPYRLDQKDNKLIIYGKNRQKINYNYSLKALSILNPEEEPVIIDPDNDFEYQLPNDIIKWGKTLVISRTPGRICPLMVDLTQTLSPEEREKIRNESIATIISELEDAKLGSSVWKRVSGWFNRSQKDDIPASSLLDLYCVALNPDTLIKFVFVLYLETLDNEKENLLQKLIYFSNDLAFQWFWLLPSIMVLANKLKSFIDDLQTPSLKKHYIQWALNQNDNAISYLNTIDDEDQYSINCVKYVLAPAMKDFYNWIKELCSLSLQKSYFSTSPLEESLISELVNNFKTLNIINYENINFVENHQENLDKETNEFFSRYSEIGHTQNEQWLCQRVNVLALHMKGEIEIFSQPDKIRRSLIFCFKSTRELFLLLLNNKLARI